uniref:Uncharacterized protein n=1 Tax=Vespula pensylvanica TaxID=30213 RepID=A0A834JSH0_VESPE|nr:hypothetical protein H0235_017143 [Vespula pensylvanica]
MCSIKRLEGEWPIGFEVGVIYGVWRGRGVWCFEGRGTWCLKWAWLPVITRANWPSRMAIPCLDLDKKPITKDSRDFPLLFFN